MPQIPTPSVGELAVLLTAVTGVLTVLLVQARGARAEARHRDAETQQILAQIAHDTRSVNTQVSNTHDTCLREDMDGMQHGITLLGERLTAMSALQQQTLAAQAQQSEQLLGVADDVRQLRGSMERLDRNAHGTHRDLYDRLRALERRQIS